MEKLVIVFMDIFATSSDNESPDFLLAFLGVLERDFLMLAADWSWSRSFNSSKSMLVSSESRQMLS